MVYTSFFFLAGLVVGVIAVASNPAPFFAALGLVASAAYSCGLLVLQGGCFLSLILFLIYLGGMLVVVAYSAAMAAEPFPETWGDRSVLFYVVCYLAGLVVMVGYSWGGWYSISVTNLDEITEFASLRGDAGGVAMIYSSGGGALMVSSWALVLTLFVVLEVTRGMHRGTLRSV
nr:NADH dehydrogenase subunit 6 [Parasudis truculenta]